LPGGAGAPTEKDPARSVASDLSAGKRKALRASFYFAGPKSRASTREKTPRHVGARRKPATDGRRIAKKVCRARYIVPLRPKGKIAGETPALRKSATDGRRIAKKVCRARLISQARRSPEGLSPRPREPCCSVDLGALLGPRITRLGSLRELRAHSLRSV